MLLLQANLNIITATQLMNEDQDNRIMTKHGWNKHTQAVGIREGALMLFELHRGLQSAPDEIVLNDPFHPLEGDLAALWDVYKKV
jgi:hypothetical protein